MLLPRIQSGTYTRWRQMDGKTILSWWPYVLLGLSAFGLVYRWLYS